MTISLISRLAAGARFGHGASFDDSGGDGLTRGVAQRASLMMWVTMLWWAASPPSPSCHEIPVPTAKSALFFVGAAPRAQYSAVLKVILQSTEAILQTDIRAKAGP
ncbi:MAG: hypothetical protein R3B13_38135 [Polyangiaceae bacterium]